MHDLQTLVDHLNTALAATGELLEERQFSVGFAQNKETTLAPVGSPIKIILGYSGVAGAGSISKEDMVTAGEEFLSDFTQFTIIQFECDTADVPVVWKALYKAMSYFNPIDIIEAEYSGYFYETGGVKGITNGRYQWQDSWKLGFSHEA